LSSDTAQPIVVTGVTTAGGALFGPIQNHRPGQYDRKADAVKAALAFRAKWVAIRLKARVD
jgi:hypothetical protein